MQGKTSVALLVSTYNNPQALRVVLESVLAQTQLPDEILIADDGSDENTKNLVDSFRSRFKIPVKHLWQAHTGFQKSVIMNKAVAKAICDYIIQIDGDILLNKHFIEDHIKAAEQGHFIRGSRCLLSESKTNHIFNSGFIQLSSFESGISNKINAMRIPFIAKWFTKYSNRSDNVHGCNCSFWRNDFIKVNGYNNDFSGWGHEDIELAARFINAGLMQKKIKMGAVGYHLYHPFAERSSVNKNYKLYEEAVRTGITQCLNGYAQQYTYHN